MKNLLLVFYFLVLISCSSNENNQTSNSSSNNFYALAVNNAWVYKNYKYNIENDTYEDTGVVDSISVVDTETISGNVYFKIRRLTTGNENSITYYNDNGEHFELLRDSVGFLIDNYGDIKHTYVSFDERVLSESEYLTIYESLQLETMEINLTPGAFDCVVSKRYSKNNDGDTYPAEDFIYYSNGYGLIYETCSYTSKDYPDFIRKLASFNVD